MIACESFRWLNEGKNSIAKSCLYQTLIYCKMSPVLPIRVGMRGCNHAFVWHQLFHHFSLFKWNWKHSFVFVGAATGFSLYYSLFLLLLPPGDFSEWKMTTHIKRTISCWISDQSLPIRWPYGGCMCTCIHLLPLLTAPNNTFLSCNLTSLAPGFLEVFLPEKN